MTAPLIATPGDKAVIDYLEPLVAPVPVATSVPQARPSKFIRVLLTGGAGRRGLVLHDSNVTVECWASTYADASALAALVDGHMHNARFVSKTLRSVQPYGAPVNLPDPDSGQHRLTATYQVTTRASAQ